MLQYRNQSKKRKSQTGVTLMEVMVAMVILTIGLYMTYTTFPLGFNASYRSKNRTIATELAQQKIEDIINNREEINCYHDIANADCRCLPDDVNDTSHLYDNLTYDCRYFYGGKLENGKVKNSTYCAYHSGTKDDINWKPFALPYNMWWYHIDVTPVIDPAKKFRSKGDLMRITVSVRGPFVKGQGINDWSNIDLSDQRKKAKGFVEVVFSTLQANKFMGAAQIDVTAVDSTNSGKILKVDNIRNFTIFNEDMLTDNEKYDYPRISLFGNHKYNSVNPDTHRHLMMVKCGGNFYNLDNVEIVKKVTIKDSGTGGTGQEIELQAVMTNKVIFIEPDDNITTPESTVKIPGKIYLLTKLFSEDPSKGYLTLNYSSYTGSGKANDCTIPATDPAGTQPDLLWWRGSKFQNFVNCCFFDYTTNKMWDDKIKGYYDGDDDYTLNYQIRQLVGALKPAQQ